MAQTSHNRATGPRRFDVSFQKRTSKNSFVVGALAIIALCLATTTVITIPCLLLNVGWKIPLISGVVIGLLGYLVWGVMVVGSNDFLVVERIGKFSNVKRGGLHLLCLPGLIDKVKINGDYAYHQLDLYQDENSADIDFTDGSAPIKAQVWWQISKEIEDAEAKYAYVTENPTGRIEELFDDTARPELQSKSLDEAEGQLRSVAKSVKENPEVVSSLEEIGVKLHPKKGVLITDIDIPEELQKLREKTLAGKKEAEEQKNRSEGYAQSIAAIVEQAKKHGEDLLWKDAVAIYEKQRGLETVAKTGSNISFVAPNLEGVQKTLGVDPKGGK